MPRLLDFFCFDRQHHNRSLPIHDASVAHELHLIDAGNMFDQGAHLAGKRNAACNEICARRNEKLRIQCIVHPLAHGRVEGMRESADRKSTRLNSSHSQISYAVFCLKKKKKPNSLLFVKKNKKKEIAAHSS